MEDIVRQIRNSVVEKMEGILSAMSAGEILCVHEEFDTFFKEFDNFSYTVTQTMHVIKNASYCNSAIRKTQFGPKG